MYFKYNLKNIENLKFLHLSIKSQKSNYYLNPIASKKFMNVSFKNFGAKYKTTIKNLEMDSDKENAKLKQTKLNKTRISTFDKDKEISNPLQNSAITKEDPEKIFLTDLRNSIIELEESRPNRFAIWLLMHSLPCLLFIQSLNNIIWVYQIFWIGSAIGLNLSAYEFYSDEKEEKILKRHLNYCLLLSIITIFIGILASQKEEVSIILTILNFVLIYLTFSRKKFQFFIPTWIKFSLRKFFPLMIILYLASHGFTTHNKENEVNKRNLKTSNEDVLTLYYRYIKEMSKIISEIQTNNPNVEYIKNQLKEGEINLERRNRTGLENFKKYF